MLLFIGREDTGMNKVIRFNTSHVTLYQKSYARIREEKGFNTSHVTLYRKFTVLTKANMRFNTSHVTLYHCSLLFAHVYVHRFNTSHVTLYLFRHLLPVLFPLVSIHLMLLFIPSSGLEKCNQDRFNTSHVTLYRYFKRNSVCCLTFQYISCYSLSVLLASLVIMLKVSIHLMLLFI